MSSAPVMRLPVISECSAESCAYNRGRSCRAAAITVGDIHGAICDTYLSSDTKGGEAPDTGRVGACKMADCRHNRELECHAPAVTVGYRRDEIDCLTYAPD
ncbi:MULTISPECIES: DUF1540 domain-containing protein [unclassified Streptomyces]|uniref:DUF1540 domain-containing protein n=1 Tax=unclassified Streptomyces TaxID=2593676 RepID=UPI001F5BE1CD|nr:DUF1540 domain-containing protein [Streptomyces sp. HSG2]